jgi:DNA-binding transcriptional LysR family regulator
MRRRRDLPSLDLLKGFESAARHLSFTKAAAELFLTQSAISRQVKALEDQLGVLLFRRENRALFLTDAGQLLLHAAGEMMDVLDDTLDRLARPAGPPLLDVTTTVSFASGWLVPHLPAFRRLHPEIDVRIQATNDVVDLARHGIDVAIRLCAPGGVPPGAVRLHGEEVFPACSPRLLRDPARPLASFADLAHHVLIHFDAAVGRLPELTWEHWLRSAGLADLRPAGSLHFSHYDQVVQAAVAGEGIAIARLPMLASLLEGGLLAPAFEAAHQASSREYFLVTAAGATERPEVRAFVDWIVGEPQRAGSPAPTSVSAPTPDPDR